MAEHRIGTAIPDGMRKPAALWLEVTLEGDRLSLSGTWAYQRDTMTGFYSGGQMQETLRELLDADRITWAEGWSAERLRDALDVWERWHLNDMRAGCEHQRAAGWAERPIDPSQLLGRACPECGYRYGTAWLSEELPDDVREWAEALT